MKNRIRMKVSAMKKLSSQKQSAKDNAIAILSLIGRAGTFQCSSIIASNLANLNKHANYGGTDYKAANHKVIDHNATAHRASDHKIADNDRLNSDTKIAVCMLIPSYSKTDIISKDVTIYKTYAPASTYKTVILTFNIFSHIKNIQMINKFAPKMVLFADIHPWYVLYWPFLRAEKKIAIIHDVEMHEGEGSPILSFVLRSITGFLIKHCDKVVVLSAGQKLLLQKKIPENKIILSRHGHFDFFKKHSRNSVRLKKDNRTLLFFGRIKAYKGLGYLLEALQSLKKKGVHFRFILAGEGDISEYKDALEVLKDNVEMHIGYVPDEAVCKYFSECSFVVLPYTEATQTGIVPIAYSFKKPVIATAVGSLPEVVINGKTGHIIPAKDVKALETAIKSMLENPALTRRKGINAYEFMKKELDWKTIVKNLWKDIKE